MSRLDTRGLPVFSKLNIHEVPEQVAALVAYLETTLDDLLSATDQYTWDNLLAPLEEAEDELDRYWSPVSHLHSVMNSEELRFAYKAGLDHIVAWHTKLSQHEGLYHAVKTIMRDDHGELNEAQRAHLEHCLRDFRLSGVALSSEKKQQYQMLQKSLTQLSTQFEDNVLDATQSWHMCIEDENHLDGIPNHAKQLAQESAQEKGLSGWLFNLEFPSYIAIMRYAKRRELREQLYRAYTTRASDQGPQAGQYDNSVVMDELLERRYELAQLLGFDSYAELSLATKIAHDPKQVINFLQGLLDKGKAQAEKEFSELEAFAKNDGIDELSPWDLEFYRELYRKTHFNLSQEDLRAYFPKDKVLQGLFSVLGKLYGIRVEIEPDQDVWHEDVDVFSLYDGHGTLRGQIICDLYARAKKRGGAWMDECRVRRRFLDNTLQNPVAYLTCNFSKPSKDMPALFTHDEVVTLFHEFGHCLHHVLTQVEVAGVSGINGVPWDGVELPSQFFENWCWHQSSMDMISGHYETGEPLPSHLFDKLQKSKHFHSALHMLRQIELALFDFRLHLDYKPGEKGFIQRVLNEVREQVSVFKVPEFVRFQHSFSHIFAGGYAAGYYSYKWAELLSCDAFSLFEEKGIFDQETGQSFLHNILEVGGSKDLQEQFVAFRGREPNIDALLRQNGIAVG